MCHGNENSYKFNSQVVIEINNGIKLNTNLVNS